MKICSLIGPYFDSDPSSAPMRGGRKFMDLDNGSLWAHCFGHVVASLFLANLSFPS